MLHSGFFIPLATARGSVTRHPWPPACSARSPVNFALRAQAGKDARVPNWRSSDTLMRAEMPALQIGAA
jgi:hypothetical protein